MNTPFSSVYTRFLRKITDRKLKELIVSDINSAESNMYGWLESAIPKFTMCKSNLTDRNSSTNQFNQELNDSEQEILSVLMVVEWLEPEVKNIDNMQNVLFGNDLKTYSAANLLKEKKDLLEFEIERADKLIVAYTFDNIDFNRLG